MSLPGTLQRGQGTKVLIVDDDDAFRHATARTLTRSGYACREASNNAHAHVVLDREPDIDAVLCDIKMPDQSGIELLRDLAADLPELAVVITTGVDDPRIADLALDVGAFGYVIKPFETSDLLINLAGALRHRQLERAQQQHVRGLEQALARSRTINAVLEAIGRRPLVPSEADEETMERLARALSLRDEETGRHIERMSRYSAVVAEAVGYTRLSGDDIRLATALHDVGKIGVPDGILLKPGSFSGDEYAAMQRHALIGHQLLAGSISPLLHIAADIALAHHEWWDGGGYPRGLQGLEIPEEARIAAVCDVFDALTSNRVYHQRRSFDEAKAMMSDLRGRQFDPRLLDAFFGSTDEIASIRAAYPDEEDAEGRIRVLVVDDHEIFVHSLVQLLGTKSEIKVAGTASTVSEAIVAALAYEPDVILMDFQLPDGDGPQATEQIKALLPAVQVVMLTARTDDQALARAIAAGCSGFVTKSNAVDDLIAAIVAAHEVETVTSPRELAPLLRQLRPTQRRLGSDLTAREREVLELMSSGLVNKQIAQRLGASINTVRNHVQKILYKLQVHSKLEAVATAVREGVIAYPGAVEGL